MAGTSDEATYGRRLEELNSLAERAGAHHRSRLAEQGAGTDVLRNLHVYHHNPRPPFREVSPGWVHLTDLVDGVGHTRYAIWWEPATDRLRLRLC